MRVALDTNVLVAAFATRGLCSDLFRLVLAGHELVVTEILLRELDRALALKLKLPSEKRDGLVEFVASFRAAEIHPVPTRIEVRDPDDIEVVRSVIAAGAQILVSGDKDLLEAATAPTAGLQIVSPRGFWEILRGQSALEGEVHEP